jgi:hypothetical protein
MYIGMTRQIDRITDDRGVQTMKSVLKEELGKRFGAVVEERTLLFVGLVLFFCALTD